MSGRWALIMPEHVIYVDDSGTDGKSRVAAAAFCVSTADRWQEMLDKWNKIADHAGFEIRTFHTTEFAACRRNHLCEQCKAGRTTVQDHPWQRWSEDKRENVLNRMAKAVVKYVDWGVGHSYTKADFDEHVRNSPAKTVANEPIAEEYVTFAIQRCGGSFAQWRAANSRDDRLRFVFDSSSAREKRDIAQVFFGAAKDRAQHEGGVEQWFDPEDVSYQSRKITNQLLAPDMVAWTVASVRALQLFGHRGSRFVEALWLAKVFASSEHLKIGYLTKETLAQWEKDQLDAQKPDSDPSNS